MHEEILNTAQRELLPLMKQFAREYYLVGGTAIALQIGHRRSIDFVQVIGNQPQEDVGQDNQGRI